MSYETGQTELPPVTDWVNDWDWLDDQWGPNASDIWNGIREVGPVIFAWLARSERAALNLDLSANDFKRPVTIVRGRGALLWEDEGREYVDCVSGHGVANLGHAHPAVAREMQLAVGGQSVQALGLLRHPVPLGVIS